MNTKLQELQSQIAQMELGYRNCSAKLLYVKDEMEEKDNTIKLIKELVGELMGQLEMAGALFQADIDRAEELGVKIKS